MQRTTIDIGIDLGTTNSAISVIDDLKGKIIPNKIGATITPSAVWLDKRGNIHVGQEAKERSLVSDQENADVEFKSRMGLGEEGKKIFTRSGREMLPEQLSAEVIKSLKTDVRTSLGEDIRAAVITVPAAFELPSTAATQEAAKLAGFEICPLLLEPVAASLAYGFQSDKDNVYWFVYDFGGGTFDAALMRIRDGIIQVVNHNGDTHLGGKNIDWDIVDKRLIPELIKQTNLPNIRRGDKQWENIIGRLKFEAERAKIEVCRTLEPSEIWIEGICVNAEGTSVDFTYLLTPQDVEEISLPHIERSITLSIDTLKEKNLSGSDLESILMVGGTTLNPWVREKVEKELGSQVDFSIDPMTVVAQGSAIFASTISLPQKKQQNKGIWTIELEHEPVGNVADPDIGGKVVPPGFPDDKPNNVSTEGYTIEFVDPKTNWRSGKVALGVDGVFLTNLYAEENRRCMYRIECCDPTGSSIPTSPDHISYTIGLEVMKPPAPNTIGIGMANGFIDILIEKGTPLPAHCHSDHQSTVNIRSGHAEDILRIPVLEGENKRANRNHQVGNLEITGTSLKRDLPPGSKIEITMSMNESQNVQVMAFVPVLDEEFEVEFDLKMVRALFDDLVQDFEQEKERLGGIQEKNRDNNNLKIAEVLAQIERQDMVEELENFAEAAPNDTDALSKLDRRLLDLKVMIDAAEDAVEWPTLIEKANESSADTQDIIDNHGDESDRKRFRGHKENLQQAIDSGDSNLLRQYTQQIATLGSLILQRQPGWWVSYLEYLEGKKMEMVSQSQAEQLFIQANRAINNNDVDALEAAVHQLVDLLPPDEQPPELGNIGGTLKV